MPLFTTHFQKKYPLDLSKCTVSKSNPNFKRPLRYLADQGQSCLRSFVLVPSGNRPEIRTITIILVKIPDYYDLTTRRDSHCHERLRFHHHGNWKLIDFRRRNSPSSREFFSKKQPFQRSFSQCKAHGYQNKFESKSFYHILHNLLALLHGMWTTLGSRIASNLIVKKVLTSSQHSPIRYYSKFKDHQLTRAPITEEKTILASAASSTTNCLSSLFSGSKVVSHSCAGIISPSPALHQRNHVIDC